MFSVDYYRTFLISDKKNFGGSDDGREGRVLPESRLLEEVRLNIDEMR